MLKENDLNQVNIIKIDIEGAEAYISEGLNYISKFKDIKILLSIHTPFFENKQQICDILMKEFEKFNVFSDKDEIIPLKQIKEMMLQENDCGWKNKTGIFFTLILKTK